MPVVLSPRSTDTLKRELHARDEKKNWSFSPSRSTFLELTMEPRTIIFGLLLSILPLSAAPSLEIGVASVPITPPPGTPMAGYYNSRSAAAVHDDLQAKAITISQGTTHVALVVCDLIAMPRGVVEEARALISRSTGLAGDSVMISATHTHTGPILAGRTARENAQGGTNKLALDYREQLPGMIARAVEQSWKDRRPMTVETGMGREERVSFNRRFLMKNGTVGWNPGKMNTNIVHPAGPIDPELPVVFFRPLSSSNEIAAAYVNFAMHLDTVGGETYSADFACFLGRLVQGIQSNRLMTVFSIGTAGDINHVNVNDPTPQKGLGEAERIGRILGGEVIKTSARMRPLPPGKLVSKSRLLSLELPKVTPEEVEKARALAVRYGGTNEPKFLEKVFAYKILDVNARQGQPMEVEIQVVAIGTNLAWVALPGEIFVELGLAIKKSSPFHTTILAELANGSIGYIPTRRAYAEGNYEPISARVAEGSGEAVVSTAIGLLAEAYRAASEAETGLKK